MKLDIKELKRSPKRFYEYDDDIVTELVKSALNNEQEATNFLFERLDKYFKYYVYRHMKIVHDTEDIIQEALLNTYKYLNRCQHDPKFFGKWATTIIKNTYFAYCNKLNNRKRIAQFVPEENYFNLADKSYYQPERIAEIRENFSKFEEAVERLPEKSKKLFTLSAIHHFTEKEIRKLTNVAPSTMHRYVAKAKLELLEQSPELKEAV